LTISRSTSQAASQRRNFDGPATPVGYLHPGELQAKGTVSRGPSRRDTATYTYSPLPEVSRSYDYSLSKSGYNEGRRGGADFVSGRAEGVGKSNTGKLGNKGGPRKGLGSNRPPELHVRGLMPAGIETTLGVDFAHGHKDEKGGKYWSDKRRSGLASCVSSFRSCLVWCPTPMKVLLLTTYQTFPHHLREGIQPETFLGVSVTQLHNFGGSLILWFAGDGFSPGTESSNNSPSGLGRVLPAGQGPLPPKPHQGLREHPSEHKDHAEPPHQRVFSVSHLIPAGLCQGCIMMYFCR
jgi:hypothetical protein